MSSRPLPHMPGLGADPVVAPAPTGRFRSLSQVTGPLPPSSYSFPAASISSISLPFSHYPPPPPPSITTFASPTHSRAPKASVTRSRSGFSFSAISRATSNATAWFSARKGAETIFEDGRRPLGLKSEAAAIVTKIRTEEDSRKAAKQAEAKEVVISNINSLLSCGVPADCDVTLKKCGQICADGGLVLSVVLQEPLIDGRPPVYWAILNGPITSDPALHALVLSLLNICQPLQQSTIASIRLACMFTSNNALLQHLFWHFTALSPLSRSDAILLSSAGGGDIVAVDETQDGVGAFVARIQIRRFRLRMRVSKRVTVEFVTSDRIWTIIFSVVFGTNNVAIGRSESQWLLSIGLGDHSMPAWVEGDFLVLRHQASTGSGDRYEPTFSLPLGSDPCNLKPGPESAIKIRLDDGPMRPHLLNESLSLVDRDGTLHAQFNFKLTQPPPLPLPLPLPPPSPSPPPPPPPPVPAPARSPSIPPVNGHSDRVSMKSSAQTSTRFTKMPRPSVFKTQDKRNRDSPEKEKKVYTSLRRGGR